MRVLISYADFRMPDVGYVYYTRSLRFTKKKHFILLMTHSVAYVQIWSPKHTDIILTTYKSSYKFSSSC